MDCQLQNFVLHFLLNFCLINFPLIYFSLIKIKQKIKHIKKIQNFKKNEQQTIKLLHAIQAPNSKGHSKPHFLNLQRALNIPRIGAEGSNLPKSPPARLFPQPKQQRAKAEPKTPQTQQNPKHPKFDSEHIKRLPFGR